MVMRFKPSLVVLRSLVVLDGVGSISFSIFVPLFFAGGSADAFREQNEK
jgi:hypothetical protein